MLWVSNTQWEQLEHLPQVLPLSNLPAEAQSDESRWLSELLHPIKIIPSWLGHYSRTGIQFFGEIIQSFSSNKGRGVRRHFPTIYFEGLKAWIWKENNNMSPAWCSTGVTPWTKLHRKFLWKLQVCDAFWNIQDLMCINQLSWYENLEIKAQLWPADRSHDLHQHHIHQKNINGKMFKPLTFIPFWLMTAGPETSVLPVWSGSLTWKSFRRIWDVFYV